MTKKLSDNRIYWLDYAKVIGIFLMIYGHGSLCGDLRNYVFSFHMPMFFFISGMLYKPLPLRDTIKKDWMGLMIPYLLLNLICYIPSFLALSCHGALTLDRLLSNWGAVLLGLGYDTNGFIPIATPCWFIYALFLAKVMMALSLKKGKKGLLIFCGLSILVTILLQYEKIDLLVPVDSAFLAIPFLSIGYLLKDNVKDLVQDERLSMKITTFLLLLLWFVLVPYNGMVDMNTCKVGNNLFVFYATATIASFVFFKICYGSYLLCKNSKIVMGGVILISSSTLLYVAFNLMAIEYTKLIVGSVSQLSTEGGLMGLLVAIVVFLEHIPICMFVIKKCPILIGKRNR